MPAVVRMNRPSHWILLFSTAVLAVMWCTGRFAAPAGGAPLRAGAQVAAPTVVRPSARSQPSPAPARIAGRVVDRFGWPVPGAEVACLPGAARERVACDAEGRFELLAAAAAPDLCVTANSYRPRRVPVPPPAPAGSAWLVVVLEDALPWDASVPVPAGPAADCHGEGFVHDERGAPAAFALVTVRETGAAARADDTGRFRVPLPVAGSELAQAPLTLIAQAGDGRVAMVETGPRSRPKGLVPLPDLVVRDGARVRGLVRDAAGQPAPQACVQLADGGFVQQVACDAHGAFAFAGVPVGSYELRVLPCRGGLARALPLAVERDVDLDLALEPERPLRVRVVDPARVAQPHVHVVATGAQAPAHAQADAAGEAVLRGLGAGPYRFEVRAPETYAPREVVGFEDDALLVVR
jgi:hypothetical protein